MARPCRAVLTLALAAYLAASPALSADFSFRTAADGHGILTVTGPLTGIDGALFLAEVERQRPRTIELAGPGGDFLSAVRMGVIINGRGLSTHAIGACRSACAYVWIAGRRMVVDEGVAIDIHLPEPRQGGEPHAKGLALFGWYLGRLSLSVEMMEAFMAEATGEGVAANRYFDLVAFSRYWNAPVEVVPSSGTTAIRVAAP